MSIEAHIRHTLGAFALDVSFCIEKPGVTALFGSSGAGKSTTINALAGLLRPREGRIVVNERVVLDTRTGVFVPPRYRRVGYVFQDARLFPHLTVSDNLCFGWRRNGRKGSLDKISDLLGLAPLLARKPAGLSGGERNRVALGRALLSDPAILLLDEPLAALDAPRRAEILPYLERLRDEARIPMVYVTHSLEEVSRLADNVILIKDGRVTKEGTVFDILSDLAFSELAGIETYGAVLPVKVSRHLPDEGLTVLIFDGGQLVVPKIERRIGNNLRLRIRAEDILLALREPSGLSANNVLAATATGVCSRDGVHIDVQLACGGAKLIARITRASQMRLEISPGAQVYAIIKSVTIEPRAPAAGSQELPLA